MDQQNQDGDELEEVYEVVEAGEIAYDEATGEVYEYSDMPFLQQQVESSQPPTLVPQVQPQVITVDNSNVVNYAEYAYEVEEGMQVYNEVVEGEPLCIDTDGNILQTVSVVPSPQEAPSKSSIRSGQRAAPVRAPKSRHVRFAEDFGTGETSTYAVASASFPGPSSSTYPATSSASFPGPSSSTYVVRTTASHTVRQTTQYVVATSSSHQSRQQNTQFVVASSSSHQSRQHGSQYVVVTTASQHARNTQYVAVSSTQLSKQVATLSAAEYPGQPQYAIVTTASQAPRGSQAKQYVVATAATHQPRPQYATVASASYSSISKQATRLSTPSYPGDRQYAIVTTASELTRPQTQYAVATSATYPSTQTSQYAAGSSSSFQGSSSSSTTAKATSYTGSSASRYLNPATGSIQFTISRPPPRPPAPPPTTAAAEVKGAPGTVTFLRPQKESQINVGPTPLSADYFAKKKKRQRTMRRLMPGKRKPCNCTKSQCLKLYCECFANGEFCYECNCKDCHNNLEFNGERSRAIKTSLERNPNAFKPKIGVAQKGKNADIERLHQKGCHCKKSNCLKNYCECYEAKVACTSRCKCRCCRNTEADRQVRFSDRFIAINNFGRMSPTSEDDDTPYEPDLPQNLRTQVYYYLTDDVVEATTMCLMAQAHESETSGLSDVDVIKSLCNEFGSCMNQIYDATRLAQQANERAAAEYKANLEAQDQQMYKGEEFKLPVVEPHKEPSESPVKLYKDPKVSKEMKDSKLPESPSEAPVEARAVITVLKPKKGVAMLKKALNSPKGAAKKLNKSLVSIKKSTKHGTVTRFVKPSTITKVKPATLTKIGKPGTEAAKSSKRLNVANPPPKSLASAVPSGPSTTTAATAAETVSEPCHPITTVANSGATVVSEASETVTELVSKPDDVPITQVPTTTTPS
uniref:CRC domain-containing protein n=1 Tax=Panagrellus redivivus TaxID=6233 RepID=A0A7E4V8U2_PANRE